MPFASYWIVGLNGEDLMLFEVVFPNGATGELGDPQIRVTKFIDGKPVEYQTKDFYVLEHARGIWNECMSDGWRPIDAEHVDWSSKYGLAKVVA